MCYLNRTKENNSTEIPENSTLNELTKCCCSHLIFIKKQEIMKKTSDPSLIRYLVELKK